jgi:hypothetical protein
MTPEMLTIVLAALAGGASVAGIWMLLKSKFGQKVEGEAEAKAFAAFESGMEWLADDDADDKVIAAATLRKNRRRDLLDQAAGRLAAKRAKLTQ